MDEGMTADDTRFIGMARDAVIKMRRESWDRIKPHHVETGEITDIEFAIDNPDKVEWITEDKDTRSPWLKEWIRLGRELESSEEMSKAPNGLSADIWIDRFAVAALIHAQVLKRND